MRIVLLLVLAVLSTDPGDIAKVNELKKEAEKAFLGGDYDKAVSTYHTLYDSMGIDEDAIHLNLGHSYYHLKDTAAAKSIYSKLSTSNDRKLKSIAYQQLGVISKDANKLEEALQQLKSAIKADPTNKEARYNYEVVKKILEEQKKQQQQQDQKNKDQKDQENKDKQDQQNKQDQKGEGENKDQQQQDKQEGEQDQKDKEGQQQDKPKDQKEGEEQKGEEQKEGQEEQEDQKKSQEQMTKEKLQEMNISEEKAKMILEAMKDNEIQYLQQQRRKAKKRPPTDKPDW